LFFFSKMGVSNANYSKRSACKKINEKLYVCNFILDTLFYKRNGKKEEKEKIEESLLDPLSEIEEIIVESSNLGHRINIKTGSVVFRARVFLIKRKLVKLRQKIKDLRRAEVQAKRIQHYIEREVHY